MQLIPGWSKRFRCEARLYRDRDREDVVVKSGRARTRITNTNSQGDLAQRSRWAFFNSLLLAILYLLGTSGFAAANPFDDASAAYERGDYIQAMKLFHQLAEQGQQWAQRRVGLMYAEGKGVPQDYEEAVKWYRIAATREDEWAQMRLGSIYAEGKGVPQDYQEAVKWYRVAAAQGYAPAEYSLGVAYDKGQGVPQDYQEAVKWYRIAAAEGNEFAQVNLGVMYTNGTGVPQDFVRAHTWFTLAALSGDSGDTATKN